MIGTLLLSLLAMFSGQSLLVEARHHHGSAHSMARDMDLSNSGRDLHYWSLFRRRPDPVPVPNPQGTYSCDCDDESHPVCGKESNNTYKNPCLARCAGEKFKEGACW